MKILVTGGAGFIGSHIVDALVCAGHEVGVVDNLLTGKAENIHPAASLFKIDLCDSRLAKHMQDEKYEYVIHHAAQIDVRFSVSNPARDGRINILGTLNLLEACHKYGVKGILFASSGGAVYGQAAELPVGEIHNKSPLSPYGVSKISVEYYLYCIARLWGLPYIALRYGNVYGPRQDAEGEAGVVARFGKKLLLGQSPVIYGDGEQTRDYVFVRDVVQANLMALRYMERCLNEKKGFIPPGNINSLAFNIASGRETSVNELFQLLKKAAGYSGQAQYGNPCPGEIASICLDVAKARSILGWEHKVDIEQGLNETITYLRSQMGNHRSSPTSKL